MSNILIFTTRQMCYDSAGFFAKKLAMNLETLGVECKLCMFAEDDIPGRPRLLADSVSGMDGMCLLPQAEAMLEQYIGKKYLAVIDFNSKLPRVTLDDGSLFLDHIDAPFVNYILDNPLYHHSMLESPLQNYHVITPDENHAEYIRRFYPNIRSVLMQPLGAAQVRNAPKWEEAEHCVLFMGTYHDPEEYYNQILCMKEEKGLPTKADIFLILDYMTADPSVTLEQALKQVWMQRYGWQAEENTKLFRLWMNHCYLAEIYLRNLARKQTVEALVKENIPVKIVGDWWEKLPLAGAKNLHLSESVEFAKSYRKIAECKVLLNSSPFFNGGMHDRIPAGMANHTLLLTDANPYLDREFAGEDCMYTYSVKASTKEMAQTAREALEDGEKSKRMVNRAYELYQMKYTWLQIAQKVLQYISSL